MSLFLKSIVGDGKDNLDKHLAFTFSSVEYAFSPKKGREGKQNKNKNFI